MKYLVLTTTLVLVGFGTVRAQSAERSLADAEYLMRKVVGLLGDGSDRSLQQARQVAQQAKSIFAAHGQQDREFLLERMIAASYNDEGRHEESRRAAQEMLQAARRANRPLWEASALTVLAFANLRLQNFEEAFLAAHRAYQIFAGQDMLRQPSAAREYLAGERVSNCYVLGVLYNVLGEPGTALIFLKEGLTVHSQSRLAQAPSRVHLSVLREVGLASLQLGDRESAIAYLESALEANPDISGSPAAGIHGALSDINLRMQRWGTAETHAQRALALARSSNNPELIADAYARLGGLALARGDDHRAEVLFQKASGPSMRADRGFIGLGRLFERRGQLESALQQYERAIELIERGVLEPRRNAQDRVNLFRQRLVPYQRSVDVLLRLHFSSGDPSGGYARQAFQANQRIRNRMFAEHLAAAWNHSDRNPRQFEDELAVVGQQITDISRAFLTASLSSRQQQTLRERLERLEVEQSAVRRKISIYKSLAGRSSGVEDWSVERVQRLLPANAALLEYNMGDAPVVFVLTNDRFEAVRLPRPDRLQERIATFFEILSRDSGQSFGGFETTGGHELFADVVGPALRTLPKTTSHLMISPSGLLELVPFEVLPTSPEGRFLIEQYSISYLPSANVLEIIREHRDPTKRKPLLLFADPVNAAASSTSIRGFFEDEDFVLGPLPYTRMEADSVSRVVGGANGDLFLGAEATESRLKTLDLTQYHVLHFATHAVGSRRHPDRSALVFTLGVDEREDGFLQVREIDDLRLNADLVVLSACQTGSGNGLPGEGIHGLARAFFFAGARSLVASLWKVEDEPTAALMTRFYQHLREGRSKADSLRQAKLDLIKEGAHPHHWAGFVLFGEATGTLFSDGRSDEPVSFFYLSVASVVLGLLLLLRFQRFRMWR